MIDKQIAWAFKYKFDWGESFLGRYCFHDSSLSDFKIRLYNTRAEARKAKKEQLWCYTTAQPVKVHVTIEEIK